jgi:hypothetical protein
MAKLSGGGIQMSKNVTGKVHGGLQTTRPVNVGGLSQYGTAVGGKIRDGSISGVNSARAVFEAPTTERVPMGNTVAASTVAGPGGSRTVMRSGTQGTHGPVVQGNAPQGRPIWPEFPPETSSQNSLVHKRG